MSTTSAALADSRVMMRRNLRHILRNPVTLFNSALMPVVLMLLLVYVFGNAFNVGEHYVQYATPGLILLAICYGLSATAVSVDSDDQGHHQRLSRSPGSRSRWACPRKPRNPQASPSCR